MPTVAAGGVALAVGGVIVVTRRNIAPKKEMYFPLDFGLRRFDRSLRADITPPELTSYGLKT
jgi:hypothetical protein